MSKNIKKILMLSVIAAVVVAFFAFDLKQYLNLEYLKSSRESLQQFYEQNIIFTIALYMAIYIIMAALSLPGAAVMTLAGGALFGFVVGFVAVSFASTIGATLACFVARYLLRDWVDNKFGDKLTTLNKGIEKEGAFYLFTLRLIPIFPFFVINLLMGLTKIRLITFYWVSQVGMIAGTMVFVNAGKELGKIKNMSDILSLELLISFALLGIFPLAVKKLMVLYQSRFRDDKTEGAVQ